jgi:hypothetical protein
MPIRDCRKGKASMAVLVAASLSPSASRPQQPADVSGSELYPADPNNTGVTIPAYRTVDVRAGLNWSRYKAQFRVANLLNERGFDTVADQRYSHSVNAPAWAIIIPPRTFTGAFSAAF